MIESCGKESFQFLGACEQQAEGLRMEDYMVSTTMTGVAKITRDFGHWVDTIGTSAIHCQMANKIMLIVCLRKYVYRNLLLQKLSRRQYLR